MSMGDLSSCLCVRLDLGRMRFKGRQLKYSSISQSLELNGSQLRTPTQRRIIFRPDCNTHTLSEHFRELSAHVPSAQATLRVSWALCKIQADFQPTEDAQCAIWLGLQGC